MPIYMDRHFVPSITAKDAAHAHQMDVDIQDEYGCRCMTYWVDEERDSAFCLIDAPSKEAVIEMHENSHGLMPYEIIPVNSNVVEAFLGRIYDPEVDNQSGTDLKVFNDQAFRIILVSKTLDYGLLLQMLGDDKTTELLTLKNDIIRQQLIQYEGREVDIDGEGFVISFVSVNQAVQCAQAIQKSLHVAGELIGLRLGLHAGVPVAGHEHLFGHTIDFIRFLCLMYPQDKIILSSIVYELHKKDMIAGMNDSTRWTNPADEKLLQDIMTTLDKNWRDPQFDTEEFGQLLSLSKSSLYRKCKSITDMSPNALLREYRLLKSLQLMKGGERNIAQTTFDCGFSSPSYFTKCFNKRFGVQPYTYMKAIA